ncbi:MAG: hypothetical protein H6686_03305 [Fibrobacteria bacterium]|nr:hypothetical protein [Fibrobacteria bacterium]
MNELAQEMREIQVEIHPPHPGLGLSTVFLHHNGHHGRENLLERLNDADRFLPLRNADGKVRLHAKAAIAALICREEPDEVRETRELQPAPVGVQLSLRDGTELEGDILLLLPGARRRALDFLNTPDRFLLLATPPGACFVNKDWIDHALPLAEKP